MIVVLEELLYMQLHEIMHIWKECRTGERDEQILQTEFDEEKGYCKSRVQIMKQL